MSDSQSDRPGSNQTLAEVAASLRLLPWPLALLDADGTVNAVNSILEGLMARASWPSEGGLSTSNRSVRAAWQRLETAEGGPVRFQLGPAAESGGAPLAAWLVRLPLADGPAALLGLGPLPDEFGLAPDALDSFPIGVFLVPDGEQVAVLNPALGRLLGVESEGYIGGSYQRLFDLLAGAALEPEVVAGLLAQAVVAVAERPVVEITMAGGRRRHLEIALFPLPAAGARPPGWGGLIDDVTGTRDQLSWKIELLSILAHDIRTPLATLKGHATALLANYRQWSDSMVLEFLEAMDRGSDELVRQVDRSLALTRVEAGRLGLRPEAVTPDDLVGGALERAAGALGDLRVDRRGTANLPRVRVDPARIEEVLVNLLENAARFSPSGSPLRVGGSATEAMVTLWVEDDGPGVAPEQQDQIFEKYGQGDGEGQGSGLGLFISRKLVESHGGRLWVESPRPGGRRGARFSFTLPVMPARAAPSAPAAARQVIEDGQGERVLVIEDEPDQQALLQAILDEGGYQVRLAADGPAAMDQVGADPPDLILLDMVLPRMDGLTVCRALRRWSRAPILILSSRTSTEDLVAAIDAGADDYMTKPFQSAELLARLQALRRRAERQADPRAKAPLGGQGLVIDEARFEVRLEGQAVPLTPTEYELLTHLARHRRQVLTHEQLIDHLWPTGEGNRHRLFVHVNRLRKKIEADPENPRYIVTRWGTGYSFLPGR